MPHERCQLIRVLFNAPATLTTAHGTAPVRVLDMSLRGALIAVNETLLLKVGSSCRTTAWPWHKAAKGQAIAEEIHRPEPHP